MNELIIFLSPGEKLKQARFELNITQEQLSNEKLSRRAISNIESGIRKLNYSTANIIVERINELQKQLRQALDNDFTVEYLMEDVETQVTKEIERIIAELSNSKNEHICDELIKKAEAISKQYTVNEDLIINVNNLAIDFYLKTYNLDNALYFTNKNLKLFYARKDELNAFIMHCYQTRIYTLLEEYKNVISIARAINMNNDIKKQKEYINVCFNTALAYYFLNNFDKSIEWIRKINQNELTPRKKLNIMNLIGINLIKQSKFEEAEKNYILIIEEAKNSCLRDIEANSYSNLAEIYRLRNDNKKALEYINKALEIKVENYTYSMNINRNALLINIDCNTDKKAIKRYFEEAISCSTILKRKKVQFQLFNIYLKYCCTTNNKEEVNYILNLLHESNYKDIDTGVLLLTGTAFLNKDTDIYLLGVEFITKNSKITIE